MYYIVSAFCTGELVRHNRITISGTANTVCLIRSIFNDQMDHKLTQ